MKHFIHMDAASTEEASSNAKDGTALFIAGGTDLIGTLKDEILPGYPTTVINLKTIDGMSGITEEGDLIKIGALTPLDEVAENEAVIANCAALSEACSQAASPTIRMMGTIGGNICQMHRCWYFRVPDNRFACLRKGGDYCPALIGDNRYHSIYGDQDGCYAASSQDSAPALIALGATIVTSSRSIPAEEFFAAQGERSCVLEDGEVVTEIQVPKAEKSAFNKFALRKSIDFPLVNCAVAQTGDGSVRIAVGGVYPAPIRVGAAEQEVAGSLNEDTAAKAGDAAVADCQPLAKNEYKIEITRTLVKRTLLALS